MSEKTQSRVSVACPASDATRHKEHEQDKQDENEKRDKHAQLIGKQ